MVAGPAEGWTRIVFAQARAYVLGCCGDTCTHLFDESVKPVLQARCVNYDLVGSLS